MAALTDAIDALVAADPSSLADAESVVALQRQLARLEAVAARSTAAFDAAGEWAVDGARNATAWLATRWRLPKPEVRRRLRAGRACRQLPGLAAAWEAGNVAVAHVGLIAGWLQPRCAETLQRDEAVLADKAATLSFADFARVLHYWGQMADPDGAEEADALRRERREVYLAASFEGMWMGRITLDPISGGIVSRELERIEMRHFDVDRAEARERLGREPSIDELERTPGQRRADALVEMARRSMSTPADARRPMPLFSVLVDYETLHGRICELAEGIPIAPGSLVPWFERAEIERAVFTPGNRVEIGVAARFYTGATRRGIELRDRRCTHPYCDQPAYLCEVDHIVPWALGGPTSQENGRLLCGFHNRLRNSHPPP